MSLEIHYIDAPDGAQENMQVSGENGNALSKPALVAKGSERKAYATFEPGIWKLDGTVDILPDDPKVGWWSSELSTINSEKLGTAVLGKMMLGQSGSETSGRFANTPKITLTFPLSYATTGFTFRFSPETNQWCSEINARFYNNHSKILEKTYYPDSPEWTLKETIESFDAVEFELIKTNEPGHFAKIQRIDVGQTVIFSAEEIKKVRLVNEIDHSLCELPVDTMEFEMYDPRGRSFLPQENQRIDLIKDGVLRASHYITSSTRKTKSSYDIKCQSAIGLLNDEFLGGLYEQKPLEELISEVVAPWEYEISPEFKNATITGYLPVCSQREALQQISFAVGAVISTQDSTKIKLVPIPTSVNGRFSKSEIMLGGSVKTSPRFSRVEVNSHTFTKTNTVDTLMDGEELSGEGILVTFTAPHYDYEITNGTLDDFGVNWVKITPFGAVTLTGKAYLHSVRTHTRRNTEATIKEKGNYISVTDCTLINNGNVQAALDRLYQSKRWRQTSNQNVVVKNQKAGQIVSSMTPWGSITKGYITSMDSTLTQKGHIANIQIQGAEISVEPVWLYAGEIYSGGMEVLY